MWTTKPFSILAIRLFHFLVIHGFTELVFLIFFKNLSIAFTAWLTVRCKRPSFQPILAFHKPSSLSLIISNFLNSVQSLSRVRLFVTPWTVARQTSLSMGFSRQEYWSGLPCPPPGDLSNPGIEPRSHSLQADSIQSEPPGKPMNTRVGSLIPSPGKLHNPGIEPGSSALQMDSLSAELPGKCKCYFLQLLFQRMAGS